MRCVAKSDRLLGINEFWKSQNIDKATFYCYYPEADYETSQLILDENDDLNPTIIDSLKIELEQTDLETLTSTIFTITNFGEDEVMECFDPHHGIIFKSQNKIVGHVSICFECNQYKIKPNNASYIPMKSFWNLCKKHNLPIDRKTIGKLYRNQ